MIALLLQFRAGSIFTKQSQLESEIITLYFHKILMCTAVIHNGITEDDTITKQVMDHSQIIFYMN